MGPMRDVPCSEDECCQRRLKVDVPARTHACRQGPLHPSMRQVFCGARPGCGAVRLIVHALFSLPFQVALARLRVNSSALRHAHAPNVDVTSHGFGDRGDRSCGFPLMHSG